MVSVGRKPLVLLDLRMGRCQRGPANVSPLVPRVYGLIHKLSTIGVNMRFWIINGGQFLGKVPYNPLALLDLRPTDNIVSVKAK